ncbi:Rpn family recombination-promoting nuclease/putative transposase, partial [Pollutimonas bauzanensis]
SPHMVRALFQGILPPALLAMLDLDTLEPLPTNYVSGWQRDRRGDLVWRVRRRDGIMLYLLILLEHQSDQDRIMGIRIMGYSALLYEDITMRDLVQPPPQRLPPVLPIVLYSGESRWTAPTRVADLMDEAPPVLQPYQPDMRYLVLDEGALVEQGGLPGDNLAGLLFRLEHSQGIEQTQELLQTILRLTRRPQYRELRRAFGGWVRHVLFARALPQAANLPDSDDLQEISTMLTTHSKKDWGYQWRQEGAADMLERQMTRKFGSLPDTMRQRLREASGEQLEAWSLNVLDAAGLEDVFDRGSI